MDPFAGLPWFILRDILSSLPDLFSLHSLYNASPGIATFLRENNAQFAQITDAIMARPSRDRGLMPYIRDMLRLLVLLWSRQSNGTDAAHSYTEILESISRIRKQGPYQSLPVVNALPPSTPSALLFRLLALVTRLQPIAHSFFHTMIDRCLKLSIEQLPLGNGEIQMEEQRILGSLLCVVFFYDLRTAHAQSLGISEISRCEEVLLTNNVEEFWHAHGFGDGSQLEQLGSLLLWLDEQAGGRDHVWSWMRSPADLEKDGDCCQQYTLTTDDQTEWDETDPESMYGEARVYRRLFHCRISNLSPIKRVQLSYFRPYGVMFWETARLQALGFTVKGLPTLMWFAFSSIFSEQDWEDLVRRQRAWRQQHPNH
ncbi:hypothetical protein BJX62DRAFT_230195 [Aspergillus germanicus]